MGKNIRKIQKMLSGEFGKKPQVGYEPKRVDREVGEIWEDSEGIKWEQRNGYKIKVLAFSDFSFFSCGCA